MKGKTKTNNSHVNTARKKERKKNKPNEKRKGKTLQSDRKKKIISPTKKEKEKNGGTQTNPDEHGNRRERLNECSREQRVHERRRVAGHGIVTARLLPRGPDQLFP